MNLKSYPTMHPQVAAQMVDDAAVIVLADAGEVNVLNPVGTRVWELSDGSHTIQQIIETIADEFDVAPGEMRVDVEEFLETLVQYGTGL